MTLIMAQQSRGLTRDITIQDTDDVTITPGANDNIRAIIGRVGEIPKLTITGGTATANGSTFTKNYTAGVQRLRLDASDLAAIDPGVYTLFIEFFDRADASEWKTVDRQCICIEDT